MRPIRHLTPVYLKDRLAELWYQRRHMDLPWLTKDANMILSTYLLDTDVGLEFGSGRSTVWLASRSKHLTSVEHYELWYTKVDQMLKDLNTENVDYRFCPKDAPDDQGDDASYVKVIDTFEPNSIDYALVDGQYRAFCVLHLIDKLRPGGLLIIDNVNRYLPCSSKAPATRTFAQGPDGEAWVRAAQAIASWRKIWTTSGVTDTAFFFKPISEQQD